MDVFSLTDMRPQLVAAGLFLLIGLLVLVALRRRHARRTRGWALTIIAFLGGPVIAVIWWTIYAFLSGECITNADRFEELWPFLAIGGIVGTAAALGVAASDLVRTRKPNHIAAHEHAAHHRHEVIRSTQCGCFYCLSIFEPAAITAWVDEAEAGIGTTALCPKCGIDSVIGSASGFPITVSFLDEMRQYWFAEKSDHPALS
jgi:hypothetical protein